MSTNVLALRVNCSSDISSTITKDKIEKFTDLLSQVSIKFYVVYASVHMHLARFHFGRDMCNSIILWYVDLPTRECVAI